MRHGNDAGTGAGHHRDVTDGYRSYVVRVRQRLDDGPGIRLDLEDLLDGGRASLHGTEALVLAERLRSLVQPAARQPESSADDQSRSGTPMMLKPPST